MKMLAGVSVVGVSVLGIGSVASAQSINIDIDAGISNGHAEPPSSSFGAAANQPGYWNAIGFSAPAPLSDLNGQPTGATFNYGPGDITGVNTIATYVGGSNSGDYQLLMNDYYSIGTLITGGSATFTIAGLTNGSYQVYTYASNPGVSVPSTSVSVLGSTSTNPQFVIGPSVNNTFALGITHSLHDVLVTNGTISITVSDLANDNNNGSLQGIQIVQTVPAPGAAVLLLGGLAAVGRRRRRAV
jgi:hypothetical protein